MTFRRRPDHKLAELRRLPLLDGCPERELHLFARLADQSAYRAGDLLAAEGEPQRWFHLLVEGGAEVWSGDHHVATLRPGDTVGEAAALTRGLSPTTVMAHEPGRSYVLGTRELRGLLAECPAVASRLMERLSHRVVTLETVTAATDVLARPRLHVVTG